MSLRYYLVPNKMINAAPGSYRAVSVKLDTYTLEDLFEWMTREGSTITTAEALAINEESNRAILEALREGNSVVTPLVRYAPAVRGVFESDGDRFDRKRHRVFVNVTPGPLLREIFGEIPTRKIESHLRRPDPVHYFDSTTGTRDRRITPGGGARILGSLLKFDEEDERQGIFFLETPGKSAVRVNRGILKNKPKELIFVNPELPPGNYTLEVRSLIRDTTDPRAGALQSPLTVD